MEYLYQQNFTVHYNHNKSKIIP